MKFQKSTWILILIALLSGGVIYVWEVEGRPQREAAKTRENRIFPFEEKDVKTVTLKTKDYKLQFDKVSQQPGSNPTAPKWMLKILELTQPIEPQKNTAETQSPEPKATESPEDGETKSPEPKATESPKDTETKSPEARSPKGKDKDTKSPEPEAKESPKSKDKPTETPKSEETKSPEPKPTEQVQQTLPMETPASEPYVVYLLNLLATGKGDRILADPRTADGLDEPLATIDVKLNNGKTHQLILGKLNFNNTALYAIADPPQQPKQMPQVLLVSTDFQNAVNRPLSEWKLEGEKKESSDKGLDKPAVEDSNKSEKDSEKPVEQDSKKPDSQKSDKVESEKGSDKSGEQKSKDSDKPTEKKSQ